VPARAPAAPPRPQVIVLASEAPPAEAPNPFEDFGGSSSAGGGEAAPAPAAAPGAPAPAPAPAGATAAAAAFADFDASFGDAFAEFK
jgi:hypothetical protein